MSTDAAHHRLRQCCQAVKSSAAVDDTGSSLIIGFPHSGGVCATGFAAKLTNWPRANPTKRCRYARKESNFQENSKWIATTATQSHIWVFGQMVGLASGKQSSRRNTTIGQSSCSKGYSTSVVFSAAFWTARIYLWPAVLGRTIPPATRTVTTWSGYTTSYKRSLCCS